MIWNELTSTDQLDKIIERSYTRSQVIFKHSTKCSISSLIKGRLAKHNTDNGFDFYLLDLLSYRSVSNLVAEKFQVWHESPQVLLIKNGECVYNESHLGISLNDIFSAVLV